MINNINTLQNLPESAGLQTYTDIYLKQSLANLGQRFSLKGDGVQAGEFSIYELFGHEYDEAAHSNAYIKAEVSENKIVLSYYENTESQLPQEVLPIYGSSYYITTEDIELPGTPILNTEYYGNGGIINKYDEKYVVTFSGYDDESNLTEIISEEYKVGSNIIEDAVRFYYSDADDKVKAVRIHTKPYSHTVDNIYVVKIYESNIKSLNDLHSILFDLVDSVVFGNEEKASPKFIVDTLVDNGFLTLSLEDEATYNEDGNQYVHFDSDIKNVNAEYETYINAFA